MYTTIIEMMLPKKSDPLNLIDISSLFHIPSPLSIVYNSSNIAFNKTIGVIPDIDNKINWILVNLKNKSLAKVKIIIVPESKANEKIKIAPTGKGFSFV